MAAAPASSPLDPRDQDEKDRVKRAENRRANDTVAGLTAIAMSKAGVSGGAQVATAAALVGLSGGGGSAKVAAAGAAVIAADLQVNDYVKRMKEKRAIEERIALEMGIKLKSPSPFEFA